MKEICNYVRANYRLRGKLLYIFFFGADNFRLISGLITRRRYVPFRVYYFT